MNGIINCFEVILYVADQETSTRFYRQLFGAEPDLYVPGMTEFVIAPNIKLGLMPNENIARILRDKTPHPATGAGIPRCELYLYVNDIARVYDNAIAAGAKLVSPIEERNWGDIACYFADPDGHVVALAQKLAGS